MGLNDRQRRFAQALVAGASAAEAARQAGYSADAAETNGPRLLRNAQVQAYVQELRNAAAKDAHVTVANLVGWLRELAEPGQDKRPRDRIAAIELLGKHLGAWAPQQQSSGSDLEAALEDVRRVGNG